MREVRFIKLNVDRWKRFSGQINDRNSDADELADLYIQLTDDLAYAQTYYPQSGTINYLNALTVSVHHKIYRNKKEKGSRFLDFFKYEVPLAALMARRQIAYAFIIFILGVAIGVVSTWKDPDFLRVIFPDSYINMTMENIKHGDPMGVYKDGPESTMFIQIAGNNLGVMIRMFVLGVVLSIFTGYMLFSTGVMIGVFQFFFAQKGLFLTSSLVIWIHGTLEISSCVLAGAAGLYLGNSLLFPRTFTRMQSLRFAGLIGSKICLGLIPVIITAAFLESFVTRHTEMPIALSLFIILSSLTFIVWYFYLYPKQLMKRNAGQPKI